MCNKETHDDNPEQMNKKNSTRHGMKREDQESRTAL